MKNAIKEKCREYRFDSVEDLIGFIIQSLKAPKAGSNGLFNYRTASGILQLVKPHLDGGHLKLNDEVVLVGDRYYIRSEVSLSYRGGTISAVGWAREGLEKKGLDVGQITGVASTYARKRGLEGLFCIDDSKADPDIQHNNERLAEMDLITKDQSEEIANIVREKGFAPSVMKSAYLRESNNRTELLEGLTKDEADSLIRKMQEGGKNN